MSWDKGFDFRGSSGYVTDPANCTYVLDDQYPTTRNSVTFGWSSSDGAADRNNAVDPRLAGMAYTNTSPRTFRVDLPAAGDYEISLAVGDDAAGHDSHHVIVKDTTTGLIDETHTTAGGHFFDALGADYTAAAWPAGQTPVSKTFATTILNMELRSEASTFWTIAHLFVSQAAAVASAHLLAGKFSGPLQGKFA